MTIATGPCESWAFTADCCTLPEGTTQAVIDKWRAVATKILWQLSGMRWGPSCPITVRPCRRSCVDELPLLYGRYLGAPWIPYIGTDGAWRNASLCGCTGSCSCGELCEIYLPGPVFDIVSVRDGTVTLPATAYRVDNGNSLVRLDGACWQRCYDLAAPPGTEGTLTVTYRTGLPLDAAALAAFSALVCHYIGQCATGCGCALAASRSVSRVSRQGVDMEFADAAVLLDGGRTGIPLTDAWLAAVNPYRLTGPSTVRSPDVRAPRVTTWP